MGGKEGTHSTHFIYGYMESKVSGQEDVEHFYKLLLKDEVSQKRNYEYVVLRWRRAQGRTVFFFDESRFMFFRADGRSRIC